MVSQANAPVEASDPCGFSDKTARFSDAGSQVGMVFHRFSMGFHGRNGGFSMVFMEKNVDYRVGYGEISMVFMDLHGLFQFWLSF